MTTGELIVGLVVVGLALQPPSKGGKPKPKPKGDVADGDGDAACPQGAPIVYDGPNLYPDTPTPELVPLERIALVDVAETLMSDAGYPQPAVGLCTLPALEGRMQAPPTGDTVADRWSAIIAMLAVWRVNYDGVAKGKGYPDLSGGAKARYEVFVRAAKLMMGGDDDEEYDEGQLDQVVVTDEPTAGAWYRVKKGQTLLYIAGRVTKAPAGSAARLAYAKSITTHKNNAASRKPAKLDSFDMKYLGGYTMVLTPEYDCKELPLAPRGTGNCFPLLFMP